MKNNFRGKIREFLQSEEGKVGIKTPLTLGVATGGILLAQAIIGTPDAAAGLCNADNPCMWPDQCQGPFVDGWGTCY